LGIGEWAWLSYKEEFLRIREGDTCTTENTTERM